MARPNYTPVKNLFDNVNISESSIPSTSNTVCINTDFFSNVSMQKNIVRPNTENISFVQGTLTDDPPKFQNFLQTEEHIRPSCELYSQYTQISSNPGCCADSSTKVANVTPSMSIDSLVRVGQGCESPKSVQQLQSPVAHISQSMYKNKMIMDMRKPNMPVIPGPPVLDVNALLPSTDQSYFEGVVEKNPIERTDISTKLVIVPPSMDSLVRTSMECEIPTGILQLPSPILNALDCLYENKVTMDTDKPNRSVLSEPSVFQDNLVLPSIEPSYFETVIQKNPIKRTDNNTKSASVAPFMDTQVRGSLECESTDDVLQLHSATVHPSDCMYENKVIMDMDKRNMSVLSDSSVFEDKLNQPSTDRSGIGTLIMQNPIERKDNLLTKSFDMNYNLTAHFQTRSYQNNCLLTNTDASNIRLPLAGTGYFTEKTFVDTNRNQSSMPNVLDLSGYQGNSFVVSTEQLIPQHSVPSSIANPFPGTQGSFGDRDISNMSYVAGPSGYESYSGFVSIDTRSRVTSIRDANGQRNYLCHFCEYKTNIKSNMEKHMRVHTGERPFQCKHCPKCFKQKCVLERHVRIHTR